MSIRKGRKQAFVDANKGCYMLKKGMKRKHNERRVVWFLALVAVAILVASTSMLWLFPKDVATPSTVLSRDNEEDVSSEMSATTITLSQDSSSVQSGKSSCILGDKVLLRGRLMIPNTSGVSGATVTLTITLPTGSSATPTEGSSITTDASGKFTMTYTPKVVGSFTFTANFAGNTQFEATEGKFTLLVIAEDTPDPITFDYKVSSSVVKKADGSTAYTGSSFTAALQWAVSQTGKKVYVPAGTYSVTASIYPKTGVTLLGDGNGADGTVFQFTTASKNSARICLNGVNNVILKQFRVTGYGNTEIWAYGVTCGNHLLQDITWYRTSSLQPAAFMTWISNKGVIDGVRLIRCQAIETGCIGFGLEGDRANADTVRAEGGWVKNFYFEDCKAIKCGQTSRFNDWVCGFDLAEGLNVQNMRLVRCESSYSWMDGYHFERWPYVNNVTFENCKAYNNGLKGYGYGFLYNLAEGHQVTIVNCNGSGNPSGDTRYGDLPN